MNLALKINQKKGRPYFLMEMKKNILVLIFILISLQSLAQKKPIEVRNGYQIEIQTSAICEMCKYTLEKDLTFEKGVKDATLNLGNKVLTILYNPQKTDVQTLRKRITKVGYHADTLARDAQAYENLPMCCKDGSHGTPTPQVPIKTQKDNNR